MTNALLNKSAFNGLDTVTHLCTGGESPWLLAQDNVYRQFANAKSDGFNGRERMQQVIEACRENVGEFWRVPANRVCFLPSCADAMGTIASGISFEPGDNIVTSAVEFPSVAWAWRELIAKGVEIKRVEPRKWTIEEDDLINAVDSRTRVVAVSQVSFFTGQCLDIDALANGLDGKEILLVVDATHASGVIPVNARATDVCMSSSYKWMLGTTGCAPCYFSERATDALTPSGFGWRNIEAPILAHEDRHQSASAPPELAVSQSKTAVAPLRQMPFTMEPGNVAVMPIVHLKQGLDALMQFDASAIADHARALSSATYELLKHFQLPVITPLETHRRSGNMSFLHPRAEGVMHALARHGVLVWGDCGRVRISTHLFNDVGDVERLSIALEKTDLA